MLGPRDFRFQHYACPIGVYIDKEALMPNWLYRLTLMHKKIDTAIDRERQRRSPDPFRLLRLRKLRLAAKDRIAAHLMRPRTA